MAKGKKKNRKNEYSSDEEDEDPLKGGAVEAWTDQDMDGIGVASQGCVCLACLVEIE